MSEQEKPKLFREKSLEAVESPESLNDYLRVTSPGVWLVLAAVIVLLVGAILWGVFGHIRTTAQVAVSIGKDQSLCYVPYESMDSVAEYRGSGGAGAGRNGPGRGLLFRRRRHRGSAAYRSSAAVRR